MRQRIRLRLRRRKGFTSKKKTVGLVGNRQRIAIWVVAQQELAFVVGAPVRGRRTTRTAIAVSLGREERSLMFAPMCEWPLSLWIDTFVQ
jgi:hypothetical protein